MCECMFLCIYVRMFMYVSMYVYTPLLCDTRNNPLIFFFTSPPSYLPTSPITSPYITPIRSTLTPC
ncbi:hypothetical protein B484DRAFT_449185 [Ochromonadaceae sp. CCMP2298]|nr:hypothetical protein B484DRAFT_449185 [Ochromonadaceae sp. CCMP2298]